MSRPKLVYLARRNPTLDPAAFVARWRRHGALGMSMPRWKNICRYAHCDVLRGNDIVGVSEDHDGVGIVWHSSRAARRAHREDRSAQDAMERDELETFVGPVAGFCALYDEVMLSPPVAGARVKLMRFLRLRPSAGIAAVATILDGEARIVAAELRGHVRNIRSTPEGAAWGLAYDLLEEYWFDDILGVRHTQARRSADLAPLVDDDLTLLTNEVVLYRLSGSS